MTLSSILLVGSFLGVDSFQLPLTRRLVSPQRNNYVVSATNGEQSTISAPSSVISPTHTSDTSSPTTRRKKNNENDADTLLKFSTDVQHVLHNLRAMESDPCIPKHLMGHHSSSLSYSKTWTLDDWEFHNSRKRYFRYLKNIPHSRLMRRIMPQQVALLIWTILSVYLEDQFLSTYKPKIPLSALGTISTFVGFLLTFEIKL